jgi:LysM repeat protein
MTLKIFLLASILSFSSACLIASPLLDSVGIENQDGKKVILHKLEPKDNYYSIGRRYNIKPNVIIQFNSNASLRVGQIIKVPTEQSFVSATPQTTVASPAPSVDNAAAATEYKVSAGETLYAISRRFNVKVEDIISQNNLKSNKLAPGQILKIRTVAPTVAPSTPPPAVVQQSTGIPPAKRDSALVAQTDSAANTAERRLPANRYGITERNERGVATYMDDAGMGLDPNKKLVLHRTAPIGTVLKITNPMTNRTTFAKVVGSFTENAATKDVVIVVTKSAADALGALDKRFQVNISYGTPTTNE